MRISDWSSDVCSSDLCARLDIVAACAARRQVVMAVAHAVAVAAFGVDPRVLVGAVDHAHCRVFGHDTLGEERAVAEAVERSEEHTSELQSLMRISYAVFCLKNKNKNDQ